MGRERGSMILRGGEREERGGAWQEKEGKEKGRVWGLARGE